MSIPISYLFFFFFQISGSILAISSSSWFGAWIGLELNLLSFIPIISIKNNPYFSEAALKYFLIQALASTFIIMSSACYFNLTMPNFLILLALMLKLGAAPFHFWFPQVMEGLTWPQAFMLMTIQKLAPMFLLSYLTFNSMLINLILFFALASSMIGALGGINQTKMRKIMAFSSINHMSWMLVAISTNDMMWIIYFVMYTLMSMSVVTLLHLSQSFTLSSLFYPYRNKTNFNMLLSMSILSLGGLPPFTGFFPKWMMIQVMVLHNLYMHLIVFFMCALVTLYFYLRMITPALLISPPSLSFISKQKDNTSNFYMLMSLIVLFNFLGLITPIPFVFL
uniref:NADH-ubiquinone oxidoreductase chain 2 n=1 Tax=Calappa bilineata TaxID=405176 RepID=A0A6G8IZV7_9EUCA|nr:NADH dehydrogenase subunit 2 [Calappa bilineata]QIM59229.1 NADH dehydrogenase subunit 2 [Calappa bilineata]